ncbi:MAG: stage II sporulation protein M [Alphaproteobacteria bacterium]|nr:stage II sporulation protein M [Alphaproteobacteria bacterium]
MDTTLRSLRFRREREESWRQLETLLAQIDRRSATSLSDDEMLAIPALYRQALSSLSVARATSLDSALVDYLESLCARAYFFVYGARTPLRERVGSFFAQDWPSAVKLLWRETLVAALITFASAFTAYLLVSADPDWYSAFVSSEMAGGRDPSASTQALRETLYADPEGKTGLSVFATFLFTHNAQIAIFAFALGFAFCLPSSMLLAYNGCALGAMFAVFAARGLALEFAGWIFIHGVTELLAIILAGAAGLRIGWSIAFPGSLSRLAAAENAGRQGATVMIGVVVMLFIAGLLEGFARQLITSDALRWTIACATAAAWGAYFYRGDRRGIASPR